MNMTTPNFDPRPLPLPPKDPGIALILEIVPAIWLQTFGIGNIYAGNLVAGVALMIGYWITCVVNFVLCFVFIGFVTWPLTWCAFAIVSCLCAASTARRREDEWRRFGAARS